MNDTTTSSVTELRPPAKKPEPARDALGITEALDDYFSECRNHMSMKLSAALALVDMMQTRFEGNADALAKIFGGELHTDATTLYVIEDLIKDAKEMIDRPGERS